MANQDISAEWRTRILKDLQKESSSERIESVDSGYGDSITSVSINSNEDRSLTGSGSLSDKSRDQQCRSDNFSDSGLAQKTQKMTISETDSGYFNSDSGFSVGMSSSSCSETSKESFFSSYAKSNDIRYLLAPFWRNLLAQNQDGDTSLHLAVINCQEKVVDAIVDVLTKTEFLDVYNDLTQTPLHLAVITRQPHLVEKLLDSGASVQLPDRNGQTCLHLACQRDDLRLIKAIFKPRPNKPQFNENLQDLLRTRNFNGITALHIAVLENNLDIVKQLLSLGADVNATDGKSGHTALHLAVEQNNLPIVSYLLFEGNANVNASSYSDCTPLHLAAGLGLKPIIATLIAAGANQALENSEEETAYDIACEDVNDILECPNEPMEDEY